MWPYSEDEIREFGAADAGPLPETRLVISPALIARSLDRARDFRSREIARLLRQAGAAVAGLFRKSRRTPAGGPLAVAAENVKTPVTVIRATAEILRDYPDLSPTERDRFLGVVLAENERIAELVSDIIIAAEREVERRQSAVDGGARQTRPVLSPLLTSGGAAETGCRP
jgi:signal transduction histidine kinase